MFKKIIIDDSETNYSVSDDGKIRNDKTGRELKGTTARNEYRSVQLTINGKLKTYMVHRLVAEAFCPNPNNYNVVHHIDEDKMNNNASNLQWVTNKINIQAISYKKKATLGVKIDLDKIDYKLIPNFSNYGITREGIVINVKTKKTLNGHMRSGYKRVELTNDNGKRANYSVHRLVYETFKGPINGVIDHIDGNKLNNHIDNLRDVDQSQNMINAQKNGHKGQIKVSQYDINGNLIATYDSYTAAGATMGVNYSAIRSAVDLKGSSCGYFWAKADEPFVLPNRKPKTQHIIQQFTKDGELVAEYNGYAEAGRAVGRAKQNIYDAVHNGYKSAGFIWKIK